MKNLHVKIMCLVLAVFIVQAMVLSSICVSTKGLSGTGERVLLSLDVCGHSGPAGVLSVPDLVAALPYVPQICIFETTGFPPLPGEAVASVEPGETGKPPEPSFS